MEKQTNWPMILGVGAIAFSALAAGLAAGPYLRGEPQGAQLPVAQAPADAPETAGQPDGMTLPEGGAEAPSEGLPEGAVPLSEDERLGDLLTEIIDGYGRLKRRLDALEAKSGGGSDSAGATRLDPDTGQEYRAVTVWVPEGMEDEAARFLREAVLSNLSGFNESQFRMDVMMALKRQEPDDALDGRAMSLLSRSFGPLMSQFGAAWRGREPAMLKRFENLLLKHAIPYARVAARHNAATTEAQAHITALTVPPVGGSDARVAYDRMRAGLRPEWQGFVDELPFDVKARYLGWCSDFLKSD